MKLFHFTTDKQQKKNGKTTLPFVGSPPWAIKYSLKQLANELTMTAFDTKIGWLHAPTHPMACEAYRHILPHNPNNIGNWSSPRISAYTTQRLEKEIVKTMISLHRSSTKTVGGYLTTGATEGIVFSLWLGRKKLEEFVPQAALCVIGTSLTHYSVRKASSIVGLPYFETPLDKVAWNMHPSGLLQTMRHLKHNGYRGFIIVLTLGYTQTGTSDTISAIQKTLNSTSGDAPVFGVIDAASNGFFLPFVSRETSLFQYELVNTFVTDFHKYGFAPYPAGIILYRRPLLKLVEKPVAYLKMNDATLLGSRPGVSAAAIWAVMQNFGKQGFRTIYLQQMRIKQHFISCLRHKIPEISIIADHISLSCGIIIPPTVGHKKLMTLEQKYGLLGKPTSILFYPNRVKKNRLYTIFFLPHLKERVFDMFVEDLRTIITQQTYDIQSN